MLNRVRTPSACVAAHARRGALLARRVLRCDMLQPNPTPYTLSPQWVVCAGGPAPVDMALGALLGNAATDLAALVTAPGASQLQARDIWQDWGRVG